MIVQFWILGGISDEQLWRVTDWWDMNEARRGLRRNVARTDLSRSVSLNFSGVQEMRSWGICSKAAW